VRTAIGCLTGTVFVSLGVSIPQLAFVLAMGFIPWVRPANEWINDGAAFFEPLLVSVYNALVVVAMFSLIPLLFLLNFGFRGRPRSYQITVISILAAVFVYSLIPVFLWVAHARPWWYFKDQAKLSYVGMIVFTLSSSLLLSGTLKKPPLRWLMITPVLLLAVAGFLFSNFLYPVFVAADSTDSTKLLMRCFLFPLILEFPLSLSRIFARMMHEIRPESAHQGVYVVQVFASLFGRFCVASMSSVFYSIVTAVLLFFIDIAVRLSAPKRDYWVIRAFAGRDKAHSLTKSDRGFKLRADVALGIAICEFGSIVLLPFIMSLFWERQNRLFFEMGFSDQEPHFSSLCVSALIQLALEFFSQTLFIVIEERYARVPVVIHLQKARRAAHYFLGKILISTAAISYAFTVFMVWPSQGQCETEPFAPAGTLHNPCSCEMAFWQTYPPAECATL
jgi:hypothetical protein